MSFEFFEHSEQKNVTPDQVRPLRKIPRPDWEKLVNFHFTHLSLNVVRDEGGLNGLSRIHLEDNTRDGTSKILEGLFERDARLFSNPNNPDQADYQRRNGYYSLVAGDIRKRKNFSILSRMLDVFDANANHLSEPALGLIVASISNMHMLLGDSDRFLVGLREGVFWKNVEVPSTGDEIYDSPIAYLSNFYTYYLRSVGKEELPLVPTRLIHPDLVGQVIFPQPLDNLEDSLETAYYDTKYLLDPRGATIVLKDSGDIRSMMMLSRGRKIWTKIATSMGEGFVVIDNVTGDWLEPAEMSLLSHTDKPSDWIKLTGEVYRDLITREKITIEDDQVEPLGPPVTITLSDQENRPVRPYSIYIPRRVYQDRGSQRIIYEGTRRPPRIHSVTFAFPKTPITDKHAAELVKWEQQTGIKVPEVPDGHTFRRPHISPKEAEDREAEKPIFVRRRDKERMEEALKEALRKTKESLNDQSLS